MTLRENPLSSRLQRYWFSQYRAPEHREIGPILATGLMLAELLYRGALLIRSVWHRLLNRPKRFPGVRVIAIGNLVVGGAGKTPAALAIATALQSQGIACGLISRGYRSAAEHAPPLVVLPETLHLKNAGQIGDEAWLLSWRSGVPIAVGKDRAAGLARLLALKPELKAVILDDGLQQRWLHADEQVLIIDERGFGNGHCLPRGPLREPVGDLERFSLVIRRGQELDIHPSCWLPLESLGRGDITAVPALDLASAAKRFHGQRILAVAGLAMPERFFNDLQRMGLSFEGLPLPDHEIHLAQQVQSHWVSGRYDIVLMTEKDAVKFFNSHLAVCAHAWALRQHAQLDANSIERLLHGFKTS
jgi:tetraacyldisaccharide 4'-kinase